MEMFTKKMKDIVDATKDSEMKYEENVCTGLDYYNLFCKAASKDQMYRVSGNNVCAFNCEFNNKDAVLLIFSIPINTPEETGAKNVAERVMDIIEKLESCFVSLDYTQSEEVKEDKFIYITVIKTLGRKD